MFTIFNSCRARSREGFSSFIMLLLLLAWGSVLLARFLQGVSIQPPEKKALLSLLNTGMPENTLRPWSETTAETLAIWDAINQGLIFVLSDFSRHVKHQSVGMSPWFLCKYITLGIFMAVIASMSTWNGTMDASADIENQGANNAAFGVGLIVALLSGLAVTYFAYSRGVETDASPWYPSNKINQSKFWIAAILSNTAAGILSFYQAQQATGSQAASTILTLLNLVGMNCTQMKVYGVSLVKAETLEAPNTQVEASKFSMILCSYLAIANWFNVISAPAMLRINLAEIKSYRAHQDDLSVLIPTVLIGMLVGTVTVALVNSFRLESIRELCSKGIPPEFYDRIGRLKAKCSLPWSSSEAVPRDLQASLLQGVNVDHA